MGEKILLVEDDLATAAMVSEALSSEGYVVSHAAAIAEGAESFEAIRPALAILDVRLPDGSGVDLCRRIRSHAALGQTPIIMLTGEGTLDDKANGFDAGADHYLVKPIPVQELRLWVKALLRRIDLADSEGGVIRAGDVTVDPGSHSAVISGNSIRNLTKKEFELLYELVRIRPKVLSKEKIMNSLWNTVLRDNTVEVHIRNLRSKLGTDAKRIVTVPGVGYRFD